MVGGVMDDYTYAVMNNVMGVAMDDAMDDDGLS